MCYKRWLQIARRAQKAFDRLDPCSRKQIFAALEDVLNADNPYLLPSVKRWEGAEADIRLRSGDYRLLLCVDSIEVEVYKHKFLGTVTIVDLGVRNTVYRGR